VSSAEEVVALYAEAAVAVAVKQGKLDVLCEDVHFINQCLSEAPELLVRLMMPSLSSNDKEHILLSVFKTNVSPLVMELMALLVRRGRIGLLAYLDDAVKKERDRFEEVTAITVTSAIPLCASEVETIEKKIHEAFGQTNRIRYATDRSLIAGYRIVTAERTIDCTVRSQLDSLREQLMRSK